jgi:hypothetical protein
MATATVGYLNRLVDLRRADDRAVCRSGASTRCSSKSETSGDEHCEKDRTHRFLLGLLPLEKLADFIFGNKAKGEFRQKFI